MLLTSKTTAGAMSRANASSMSGMAGSQAATRRVQSPRSNVQSRWRDSSLGLGVACTLDTVTPLDLGPWTLGFGLVSAGQHLAIPELADLLGVDLGPVLDLLDVLVLGIRQPLRLGVVRQLQVAQHRADRAGAEAGERR